MRGTFREACAVSADASPCSGGGDVLSQHHVLYGIPSNADSGLCSTATIFKLELGSQVMAILNLSIIPNKTLIITKKIFLYSDESSRHMNTISD